MTKTQALAALEEHGTAQNRKIYRRHGVAGDQFGVSYANLKALKKQIKTDHALARQLWATGNHDARIFATFIADPKQADEVLLDAWVEELDSYPVTDALTGYVAKTPLALAKMQAWMQADSEWIGRCGWSLLAHLAMKDKALPDDFFAAYLPVIERDIHGAQNRVREAMNNALIAIGTRSDALEAEALEVADRIGTVEVDHGETGCKTPDAAAYIVKARARQRKKAMA